MPEERGSIYKTTANEIGEALKAKLGGEGFAPKDWSENLNLLGIASEDTEAAINSLKESEGSGERGSILLSTANAIGAMLNKKYNSSRGFSPAEWASATRKMKALETDAKSGGIVNLKGAKEVPITSLVGTINPTLEGVDSITATRLGKNLANFVNARGIDASGNIYADSKRCATIDFIQIKSGVSYKVYAENNVSFILAVYNGDTLVRRVASIVSGDTLDTSGGDKFRLCIYGNGTYVCTVEADKPRCLTSDDLDTSYTPYVAPTNYTASLGRTIYGGTADIVKGEGKSKCVKIKFSDLTWNTSLLNGVQQFYALLENTAIPANNRTILEGLLCAEYTVTYADEVYVDTTVGDKLSVNISKYLQLRDFSVSTLEAFKEKTKDYYLVYPLATKEDFTFDPIPINTSGDAENFYTSNGDTSITYYEEPTPYTRGSASGGIASFSGANTEFSFTKLKATIAPSVEGVSSVVVKNEGKNLVDGSNFTRGLPSTTIGASIDTISTSTRYSFYGAHIGGGNYTISSVSEDADYYNSILIYGYSNGILTVYTNSAINTNKTVDFGSCDYVRIAIGTINSTITVPTDFSEYGTIQLEVGSSSTEYTAYKAPTVYTADLGETVYGGSVDFVSGEVGSGFGSVDMGSLTWIYDSANTRFYTASLSSVIEKGSSGWKTELVTDIYTTASGTENNKTISEYASTGYVYTKDTDYTDANAFKTHVTGHNLTYPLATPTESSIDPQEIYPREGVNNIWSDANGDTEVTYFEEE